MKRTLTLFGLLAVAVAQASDVASANARLSGSNLIVSASIRNLPANHRTRVRATADVTVTYVCVNKGGNIPRSANKTHTFTKTVSEYTTLRNDGKRLNVSITLRPTSAGSFRCPTGQAAKLAKVSYKNVRVVDTSHNTGKNISGTFSKTLLAVKVK